jgi:hypothetical protein
MRISVTRGGGLTGRTVRAELDTAGRPDADRLHALAAEAVAGGANDGTGVPAGYRYEITAGDRTVRCADPRLTRAQRELVRRVLAEGS